MKKILPLILLLAASACGGDSWYGDEKKLDVEGKRISILAHDQKFTKSDMVNTKVSISKPKTMLNWAQSGGNSAHLVGNLVFNSNPSLVWKKNIGEGESYDNRLIAEPVVDNGIVYAFDSLGVITAYNLSNGSKLWQQDFFDVDDDETTVIGAGMVIGDNILYITTGLGKVLAFDTKQQKIKWQKDLQVPVRSAPSYDKGLLFVLTADSKLFAFNAINGDQKWTYSSAPQKTTIMGGASPTIYKDKVIAVFSSGEIIAFNKNTGSLLWGEVLSSSNRLEGLSVLMDIIARPVIKNNVLYVVGHTDIFMAIDVNTGKKIWSQEIGSTANPLLVDKYIFTISNDGDLIALEQKSGKVIWVRTLPKYADEEDKEDLINWQGPIMLDSKLLIVGSYGEMAFLSPQNGNLLSRTKVTESIQIPPIYADKNLILLNSEANLMVYK